MQGANGEGGYSDSVLGTDGEVPVVPVPRASPTAAIGPAIGIAAFVAVFIDPLAVAVVAAVAAVYAGMAAVKALDARAVVMPRVVVTVLIAAVPIAARWGPAPCALASVGALFAILIWGLFKVEEPGLSDSLAGGAFVLALCGFALAHAPLIASGDFRGGPVASKWILGMTIFLIFLNQTLAGIFEAATVPIPNVKGGRGNLVSLIGTIVAAGVISTIAKPDVKFLSYMALALAISGACVAGRAIAGMLLSGSTDPEEIVDPGLIGDGYGLQTLGAALIALPAAYYVARWLFV